LAAAGAGVLMLLPTLTGRAAIVPALAGATAMALVGGLAWFTRPRRVAAALPPPAPAAGPPAGAAFKPPFADILDLIPDPILLVQGGDRDDLSSRRFVFANAQARAFLRIARAEGPLTTAIRAPEVLDAVDEALYEGKASVAVYEVRGVQDRAWRAHATPLPRVDGRPDLALLTLRDETEARRGERTRADFLANASHELRTPLASLSGFIETLRGHARDDAEARDRFLAIMQVQAERMRRLIDDLMSLSRIEQGEHIPPSGRVDIAVAVIDVLDALAPLAKERCVTFDASPSEMGGAVAAADRDQILQVIQNLAENAIKYTPAGGQVVVEVRSGLTAAAAAAPAADLAARFSILTPDHAAGRRYVAVRVRDFGPGIARNHLPRLTERFYRVEGQKAQRPGTGLGLAIVKHIVNRHRGGLIVESTAGAGAAFTVYIPMAEAPAETPQPAGVTA
jgi:two-component system phosphate regulon sensor histidine kinase PhoR